MTAHPDELALADLAGRDVVVWGAGVEGAAAVPAVLGAGASSVVVVDDGPTDPQAFTARTGAPVLAGEAGRAAMLAADVVVKSPGISRHLPLVDELRAAGVAVTGSTALWFAGHRGERVVGLTGSKGKSTTSVLVHHLLGSLGVPVRVAGNLGDPVLSLPPAGPSTWTVMEVSSFQASEVTRSPAVGVLTALFPDHLDWHGSPESYFADKLNLFTHGDGPVALNTADAGVRAHLSGVRRRVPYGHGGIHPDGAGIVLPGGARLTTRGTSLRGDHNLVNLCGALTAVGLTGIDLDASADELQQSLEQFAPLAHRLQTVSEAGGLEWVDDGLATNPDAVAAALTAFRGRSVTLLLGGHDRGVDYAGLGAVLSARADPTMVLTMPANGPRIAAALRAAGEARIVETVDLVQAVALAATHTPLGGVVLLSPGAPSFGHFRDYTDRGRAFIEAIAHQY